LNGENGFGEVRKNRRQVIRVSTKEFGGLPYVTLETWAKPKFDPSPGVFTEKRFSLHAKTWLELIPLIEAAAGKKP